MAIRSHDGRYVHNVQIGLNPIRRVWAGRRLVWVRPPAPSITAFTAAARGTGVVLSWTASSPSPIVRQSIIRVAPDGSRFDLSGVLPGTREFNTPLPPVGLTRYELHVETADEVTVGTATFERNAAPTVALVFAGFTAGLGPTQRTARFTWTIQPGYPTPHVALQHVSGPGSVDTRAGDIEARVRRGLTTGTITVTRGGGPGGATTLQLTATNSAGSRAATASSTAW